MIVRIRRRPNPLIATPCAPALAFCPRSSAPQAGADVNQPNPNSGRTPLMTGAARGNPVLVSRLLEAGADRNARDVRGFTAYYYADPNCSSPLAPPHLDNLLEACTAPDAADALERLLQASPGIDLNAGDKNHHWTVLMEAVLLGTPEAVTVLLTNGARAEVRGFEGFTALFWAYLRDNESILRLLHNATLSAAEEAGLQRVREAQARDPHSAELLSWSEVCGKCLCVKKSLGTQITCNDLHFLPRIGILVKPSRVRRPPTALLASLPRTQSRRVRQRAVRLALSFSVTFL